jgi:hypothetical protein
MCHSLLRQVPIACRWRWSHLRRHGADAISESRFRKRTQVSVCHWLWIFEHVFVLTLRKNKKCTNFQIFYHEDCSVRGFPGFDKYYYRWIYVELEGIAASVFRARIEKGCICILVPMYKVQVFITRKTTVWTRKDFSPHSVRRGSYACWWIGEILLWQHFNIVERNFRNVIWNWKRINSVI